MLFNSTTIAQNPKWYEIILLKQVKQTLLVIMINSSLDHEESQIFYEITPNISNKTFFKCVN